MGFKILSEPSKIYSGMIEDIKNAKKSIYLETYRYGNDWLGKKFKKLLIKKSHEGVEVKILVDSLGSYNAREGFFKDLIKAGGEVKFFKQLRYFLRILSKYHERNHKKILSVDNKLAYIGSNNITAYSMKWRELTIRLEGRIANHFSEAFMDDWNLSRKIKRLILHKGFQIINELPKEQRIEKKLVDLINNSKKEILIETPYFIPPSRIRRALIRAVKRKVKVKIILPNISDVKIADIVRNRYLGRLYLKGAEIHYYLPRILHSKLLISDDSFFLLGSSNLDYRSFMHQFEINLLGKDKKIIRSLKKYYSNELKECRPFDYREWKNRSLKNLIFEWIFGHFRKYL